MQPGRLAAELDEVTVVIVAYNSRQALQAQLAPLALVPSVTIVDNASTDGSADWLATALPQAKLLRLPRNIGFGRAHNLALADCATPFALLLNPDCLIEVDDIVRLAISLRQYPDALMTVPKLVYPDGREQENHRGFFHTRGRARPAYRSPAGESCCEMVSGAVLLVRVAAFRAMGGFDPWFFLYWEDEDLCIRAHRQQRAVILAPQATACHVAQTSSAPSLRGSFIRHYCYTSSKLYLRRKLGEPLALVTLRAMATLLASLLALPVNLLLMDRHKAMRSGARMAAVLTAPWQLRRGQSAPLPSALWKAD